MSVANNGGKMFGKKTLYICFIDFIKAFDRVKHDMFFSEILAGVPEKEINIIKSLYLPQKVTVRYEN